MAHAAGQLCGDCQREGVAPLPFTPARARHNLTRIPTSIAREKTKCVCTRTRTQYEKTKRYNNSVFVTNTTTRFPYICSARDDISIAQPEIVREYLKIDGKKRTERFSFCLVPKTRVIVNHGYRKNRRSKMCTRRPPIFGKKRIYFAIV